MNSCNEAAAVTTNSGDHLSSLLFGKPGHRLLNIKFYRCGAQPVSVGRMRAAVESALMQLESGQTAELAHFPDVQDEPIDMREYVKSL
jgi:hypothetical protein